MTGGLSGAGAADAGLVEDLADGALEFIAVERRSAGESEGFGSLAEVDAHVRERDFDAEFIELLLDAAVHLAADGPLANGLGFDAGLDDDGGVGEFIDAEHVERFQDGIAELLVGLHFGTDVSENLGDAVGVFLVGNADVEDVVGEDVGHVGDGGDGAVGEDVNDAIEAAEDCGAEVDFLDLAAGAIEDADVVDADLVFDEHEEAADDVLDKGLGAKAEGDAGDAGAGEDGGEVEAHLAEGGHDGDEPEGDGEGFADDAGEGVGALGHLDLAAGVAAHDVEDVQLDAADDATEEPLGDERGKEDDADANEGEDVFDGDSKLFEVFHRRAV